MPRLRLSRCVVHGERVIFSSPKWFFFTAIRWKIGIIIRDNRYMCNCYSSGGRRRSRRLSPRKRWPSPFRPLVFTFFGAGSNKSHCFKYSFISGVYQWTYASSTVTESRNFLGFRLNNFKDCVDFCHVILCFSRFWGTLEWPIKNQGVTTFILVKPII